MHGYTQATYGDSIAELYDQWAGGVFATADCVDCIAGLAGDGPGARARCRDWPCGRAAR